jgi:hypothetical protein
VPQKEHLLSAMKILKLNHVNKTCEISNFFLQSKILKKKLTKRQVFEREKAEKFKVHSVKNIV